MTDRENIHLLQDELNSLAATTDLRRKIVVLNELAWLISDIELKRAYALSETAYALAESLGDVEQHFIPLKTYRPANIALPTMTIVS